MSRLAPPPSTRGLPLPPPSPPSDRPFSPTTRSTKAFKDFFFRQPSSSSPRPPIPTASDSPTVRAVQPDAGRQTPSTLTQNLWTKGRQVLGRERSRSRAGVGASGGFGMGTKKAGGESDQGQTGKGGKGQAGEGQWQSPSLSKASASQPEFQLYNDSDASIEGRRERTIRVDPEFGEFREGDQDTYGRLGLIAASAAQTRRGAGGSRSPALMPGSSGQGRTRPGISRIISPGVEPSTVEAPAAGGDTVKKRERKRSLSSFLPGRGGGKKDPPMGRPVSPQLDTGATSPSIKLDLSTPGTARGRRGATGSTATRGGPSSYYPPRRAPIGLPMPPAPTSYSGTGMNPGSITPKRSAPQSRAMSPEMSPIGFRLATPSSSPPVSIPGSRRVSAPVTPSRSSSRGTIPHSSGGAAEVERAEIHYTLRVATTYLVKNLLPSVLRRSGSQEPTVGRSGAAGGTVRGHARHVGEEEEVRRIVEERLRSMERMERAWGIEWMQKGPSGGGMALSERTREKERKVLQENLQDGIVLCFLLNSLGVRRSDIPTISISRRSPDGNLTAFINACRSLALPVDDLIRPGDVLETEEASINRVCRNIIALAKVAGPAVHGSRGLKDKIPSPVVLVGPVAAPAQKVARPPQLVKPKIEDDVFTATKDESHTREDIDATPTTPTKPGARLFDRRVVSREHRPSLSAPAEISSQPKTLPPLDLDKTTRSPIHYHSEPTPTPSPLMPRRDSPPTPKQDRRKILIASRRMSDSPTNSKRPIIRVKPSVTPSSATGSSSFLGAKSETDSSRPARPPARRVTAPSSNSDSTAGRGSIADSARSISFDLTKSVASRSEHRKGSIERPIEAELPALESSPAVTDDAGTVSVLSNLPTAAEVAPAFVRKTTIRRRHSEQPRPSDGLPITVEGLHHFPRQSVEDLARPAKQKSSSADAIHTSSSAPGGRSWKPRPDTRSEPTSPSKIQQARQLVIVRTEGQVPAIYQLGNVLGRGQFGVVYRALNVTTGQFVAIKRIDVDGLKEEEVTQLMGEVDLLKRLSHPSIVKYEGMTRDSSCLNIVLEYIEGGSMGSTLRSFGKLNEQLVAGYVGKILEGLNYLHQQDVVHCDLKAANILTTKRGNVKLSDFGVSLNLRAVEKITNDVPGSPNWMAPEVIELRGVTSASDIWSLGCTVIELLTGKPPYADIKNGLSAMYKIVKEEMPLPDGCSQPCIDFLSACFNKHPSQRPTAEALFEHEWVVWGLGFDQILRPQDSIPFLRRISTDFQRLDSPELRRLGAVDLRSEDAPSSSSRPISMVTTNSTQTYSGSDRTSRQRSTSKVIQRERKAMPHKLVETTFKSYVTCKICHQAMRKHAVICYDCGLISHSACIQKNPSLCGGAGTPRTMTRLASAGIPGDDTEEDDEDDEEDDENEDDDDDERRATERFAGGKTPLAGRPSREEARSVALAKLIGHSSTERKPAESSPGSRSSGRRPVSALSDVSMRSSFPSLGSSRPSGEILTPVDSTYYTLLPLNQQTEVDGPVLDHTRSAGGGNLKASAGNGEQCVVM